MSSSKKPKSQKMPDPRELIALQAQMNRVNVDTPFGSQTYGDGPNGSTTLRTDIGPEGQALVGRGVGLGMTDSNRFSIDPRMNELAGALLGKVGNRFGMDLGGSLNLSPQANMPQSKPQAQAQPEPQGMPQAPQGPQIGGGFGGSFGPGGRVNPAQRIQELTQFQGGL